MQHLIKELNLFILHYLNYQKIERIRKNSINFCCRIVKQKKQQNLRKYDDVRPGPVTETDFVETMNQVKPSSSVFENQYLKWEKESGSC